MYEKSFKNVSQQSWQFNSALGYKNAHKSMCQASSKLIKFVEQLCLTKLLM